MSSSPIQEQKEAIKIFCSYAPEDSRLRAKLEKHLSALLKQGEIVVWHNRNISAGQDWKRETDKHLNTSRIILLLISKDFMASDYCYGYEMQRAIERREERSAVLIPIILSPCDWEELPISKFEIFPSNEKPVTLWSKPDAAYLDIAKAIKKAVQYLREHDEEYKINQSSTKIRSLKPDPPITQPRETFTSNQTTSRTSRKNQNRGRSKTKTSQTPIQRNAQSGTLAFTPKPKSLPKRSALKTIMAPYFSRREIVAYYKAPMAITLLIFVVIDVFGLTFISGDILHSQQLPALIFAISLLIYLWGIFNINPLVALFLTTIFWIAWFFIGVHYLPSYQIIIFVGSTALSVVRFLLFRNHKKYRN